MRLDRLTRADCDLVGKCLDAAFSGPFFPEWEFSTLFGLERGELDRVRQQWPDVDPEREDVELAVINSLNNLLGYPHGQSLEHLIGHSPIEIQHTLNLLLGSPSED